MLDIGHLGIAVLDIPDGHGPPVNVDREDMVMFQAGAVAGNGHDFRGLGQIQIDHRVPADIDDIFQFGPDILQAGVINLHKGKLDRVVFRIEGADRFLEE